MSANRRLSLRERITRGKIRKEDVLRGLGQLAFGRVNDCVKLALEDGTRLDELDLTLLSEVKKTEKGLVEVKLVDRLKVLELLAQVGGDEQNGAEEFLKAMQGKEETT